MIFSMSFIRARKVIALSLVFLFAFTFGTVALTSVFNARPVSAQEEPPADGGEEQGQTEAESCESNGGEYSFFVCPALRIANDGVQLFDTQVRERLQIDPGYYKNQGALHNIWGRLRNIAFILLIPIVLVMVISTALGFSFFDTYTIKRAMPRLLFAIVFIALSFDIGAIMINISNAATRGIQGVMVTAVSGEGCSGRDCLELDALFNSNGAIDGALVATGGVAAAVAVGVGVLSISILTSLLGTAALGLFIIFFILLARELIIVSILLVLPLAILTWIFPGNDKFWKLAWNTFTTLLTAGPIFAGFVVLGRILAFVVNEASRDAADQGGIETVILIGVKLGLILMSLFGGTIVILKFAGAAGSVMGVANDRAKGLFDRNKNFRTEKRKQLGERAAAGTRFNSTNRFLNPISKRTSTWSQRRKLAGQAGGIPFVRTKNKTARLDNLVDLAREREAAKNLKENELLAAFQGDDDSLRAAREYMQTGNRKKLDDYLKTAANGRFANEDIRRRTIQMIDQTRRQTGDAVLDRIITDSMPATGTGYNTEVVNPETGEVEQIADYSQFSEDLQNTYGNSIFKGAKVGSLRSKLTDSGHMAGKVSFGTAMGTTGAMAQDAHIDTETGEIFSLQDAKDQLKVAKTVEDRNKLQAKIDRSRKADEDEKRFHVRNTIIKNAIDSVPKSHITHGKPYGVGQNADAEFQIIQGLAKSMGDISTEIQAAEAKNDTETATRLRGQLTSTKQALELRMGDVQNIMDGFMGAPLENVEVARRRLTDRVVTGSAAIYNKEHDLTVSEIAVLEAATPGSASQSVRGPYATRTADPALVNTAQALQTSAPAGTPAAGPTKPPGT